MSKIIARSFIHSCYVPDDGNDGDGVVVCEHIYKEDGSVTPNLRVMRNPCKTFYITKKEVRETHDQKKEREKIENLDKHTAPTKEFFERAYKLLNEKYPTRNGKYNRDEVLKSPYIYGGDMDIESLIKIRYKKDFQKSGLDLAPITVGVLDIEISIDPGTEGTLLCFTITHENKIYTAINKKWMVEYKNGQHTPIPEERVKELSQQTVIPLIQQAFKDHKGLDLYKGKLPFEFHYFVSDSEVEMIKWGFDKVHKNKTNFLCGWNLKFDVETLTNILVKNNVDPKTVFSHPSIPANLQYFKIYEDPKPVQHFTEKWHWFYSTAYFQFLDLMSLYSRLRTVEGKEYSYALDYILKKNGLGGKIHWESLKDVNKLEGTSEWHRKMASHYFAQYVVYNQWDCISLQLLEWLNHDVDALRLLSDNTPIAKYPRQSVRIRDTLYAEWIEKGYIIGTSASDMREKEDSLIEAKGGAVLSATAVVDCGVKLLEEFPDRRTQVHVFVSDADFSQMYPTIMESGNIAKETKVSTVYEVQGDHIRVDKEDRIERLHSHLINLRENAHNIGVEYLNLPELEEIKKGYEEYRQKRE